MIDVRTLYKEEEGNYCWYDYQPMVEAFGNVVVQVDDDDYQGDTRVLYDNNGKIGHLVFGWGSCSGCDALQACETLDEVQELCNMLENSIIWFDSKAEALKWFETHDWEGSWEWFYDETKKYVNLSIKYLEGENNGLQYIYGCGVWYVICISYY